MRMINNSQGFTLLETMIAMTIMLLAFASILMVQSSSMNTSAKAKQMNIVGMLAKNALLQTEVEMTGKRFSELQEETSEAFEEPFQDYTWVRTVKEIKFPNLSGLLNAGKKEDQPADEQAGAAQMMDQMTKLMTNFISKAIREVTITIKWKRGSGEQKYVVAMYWVDLNSEFQLSP
jgi:prepilin-type N-terminal cleavage/methylation domain-containing protein